MKQAYRTLITEADRHRRLGRPLSPDLDLLLETDHAGDTTNLLVRKWTGGLRSLRRDNELAALGASQSSSRRRLVPTPWTHNFVICIHVPSIPAA